MARFPARAARVRAGEKCGFGAENGESGSDSGVLMGLERLARLVSEANGEMYWCWW